MLDKIGHIVLKLAYTIKHIAFAVFSWFTDNDMLVQVCFGGHDIPWLHIRQKM